MIRFSFVLCVNKHIPYLKEAIDSMLNQSYSKEYEIVIVSNNCTNELYDWLCVEYSKFDNVMIYRTPIGQLAYNLNYGVSLANGEYIVRMDADDISLSSRLEDLDRIIDDGGKPDVIGTAVKFIDDSGVDLNIFRPIKSESISRCIYFKNPFVHPSICVKKSLLLEMGGYLGGYQSEDYDLWLRVVRKNKFTLINSELVTLKYRISEGQSRGRKLPYAECSGHLLREFLLNPSFLSFSGFFFSIFKSIFLPKK